MSEADAQIDSDDLLSPEGKENVDGLVALNGRLEELDSTNRKLYEETLARYDALILGLILRLRDKATPGPDKGKYVKLKKQLEARRGEFANAFPELQSEDRALKEKARIEAKAEQMFDALDQKEQIGDEEKTLFKRAYHRLPINLRGQYLNQLKGCLKNKDQAGVVTGFRAILFELSRRALIESQGKETLGNFDSPITVQYLGYDKKILA